MPMVMTMTMAVVAPPLSFLRRRHHHHQLFLGNHKPKPKPNLKLNTTSSRSFFPPKSSLSTSTQSQPINSPTQCPNSLSLSGSIQSLCESGHLNEAFELLQSDPKPTTFTNLQQKTELITTLLHACGQSKDLELGRKIHQMVSNSTLLSNVVPISTRLITMYSMCESPLDACLVFNQLENRNLYQWNALISGFNRTERWVEAILVFYELLWDSEFKPDNYTMPCVIKASGSLKSLALGRIVHGMAVKIGLCSDSFVCHSLIAMYGKCGNADEAVQVFDNMPERNVVSWNSMIFAFSESGFVEDSLVMFREILMDDDNLIPDVATLVSVLPVCADKRDVKMGRVVHALAVKLELIQELKVRNALLDMYMKCGCVSDAETLFSKSVEKNVVSWNAMIGGYSGEGDVSMTFNLLRQMQMAEGETMKPNAITILNVLPVCLELSELGKLKELHGYAYRNGFECNALVTNGLVASYSKCGSLASADYVFNNMDTKTVSSWNALISGYAQNGDPSKAVDLFRRMTSLGLKADSFSISILLLACGRLKSLRDGKAAHGFLIRNGFESDLSIGISLIPFYNQYGKSLYALAFFNKMQERDLICWEAMIDGLSQNGLPDKAINLYRQMQLDQIQSSAIAMVSVLSACAQLSALRPGREIHCVALKAELIEDTFVSSSIIDMYAKCGSVEQSHIVFDRSREKDVVS